MAKILFLVTQSEMGGAQRYIYEVVRGLNKSKYEILVAAGSGDGELFQKLQRTETRSLYLLQMRRTPNPLRTIMAIAEIVHILKRERPDVLFLCSTTAGLLGSIASFLYRFFAVRPPQAVGPRVIYRIGGWAFRDPRLFWQNWIILLAEKLAAPLKDKIIVNSEIDRKLGIKYKIAPPEKIVKIYNGIDLNALDFFTKEEARSRLKLSFNRPLIGCVANFYKTKGLEYLIKAMPKLVETKFQRTKLIIIGDGRLRPKLEAQIKKLGLENQVFLAGRIPDAYKYLKAFDVFVLPSLKEGFPWIILEAIAAKVPIVATKVGAVPEILDEEFLVELGNPEALAKKISRILEHPAVPKLKPEFTYQTMLQKTDLLLQEMS